MQLFTQLRVGAEDSPDATLTLHAHPNIEGVPWYDDVLLLGEREPRLKYTLARLVAFVLVRVPRDAAADGVEQELMLAFTHVFCAPGSYGRVVDLYSPECRVAAYLAGEAGSKPRKVPVPRNRVTLPRFPMMQLAFEPKPRSTTPIMWLVDTLSIKACR